MTIFDEVLGIFAFVGAGLEFMVVIALLEKSVPHICDVVENGVDAGA